MKRKPELQVEEIFFRAEGAERSFVELPASRFTFLLVLGFAAVFGIVVVGRVGFLVAGRGDFYVARASVNAHKEVTVVADRGIILDRFGEPLVQNSRAFSVFADMGKLQREGGTLSLLLERLSEVAAVDAAEVAEAVNAADFERTNLVLLARNVTPGEAIAVKALGIPALEVIDDSKRAYVDGPTFAHVVGYTGAGGSSGGSVGRTGLEEFYNATLQGEDGRAILYRDAAGAVFESRVVAEPVPGKPLDTTIDADLQRFFYRRLKESLEASHLSSAVGIAIDPRSGEILSLVSFPAYDANVFVERGKSAERTVLLADSSQPLFNRAVSGLYNPGSTIKPLVALAALREGVVRPEDQIFSSGAITISNPYNPEKPSRFLDWRAHGWVDLHKALAVSSNIYFYGVGGGFPAGEPDLTPRQGLGIKRLKAYWQRFGFGVKTNVDMSGEGEGYLPDPEERERRNREPWLLGHTYNVSIGQGDLLVTPLQLLSFIGSIGNNGVMYEPHFVKRDAPRVRVDYHDWEKELAEVQQGLRDAVAKPYGSAHLLNDLPVTVAGKTGTAQVDNNRKTNAFFVGYAPADNPQIAILVLVENTVVGSLYALPVAKDVAWWYYWKRIAKENAFQGEAVPETP